MFKRFLNFVKKNRISHSKKKNLKQISNKYLGINKKFISPGSIEIVNSLQKNGYYSLIVGGAIRDILLGLKPKDFDVVTNARPEQIKKIFRRSRIIGKRFKLVHVFAKDEVIEVSTFRSKNLTKITYNSSGRITRDNSFGRRDEDANRRDLSINALYFDPIQDLIFDYHNGIDDIKNKTIRVIGNSSERYIEDPVRMLRAIRFSTKLDFVIENEAYLNIHKYASLINDVPKSRVVDEIIKLLLTGNSVKGVKELISTNLYKHVMPYANDLFSNELFPNTNITIKKFTSYAFSLIDNRILEKKSISVGFIFACLLWHKLLKSWTHHKSKGLREIPALQVAADKISEENFITFPIQKRHLSDMKEIWRLQPRFDRTRGKAPYRLVKNNKFRIAFNFLKLRESVGMIDSDILIWWKNFLTHKSIDRIDSLKFVDKQRSSNLKKNEKETKENFFL
tara:strand:+ start:593 stop:1945 length:1353 start_codon:yes stop_codon:yes gene_type:complete